MHVWLANLGAPWELEPLAGFLSAAECERARRLCWERDRQRFVGSRVVLRQLLGRYLDVDPASLVLEAREHGKPCLVGSSQSWLRFNLAHSGNLAAVALSGGREIGIDVEQVLSDLDVRGLARRHLSPAERQWVFAAPANRQVALLVELWTRKEAVLKGTGAGLSISPERVEVLPGQPVVRLPDEGEWWLTTLASPPATRRLSRSPGTVRPSCTPAGLSGWRVKQA